jgi:3-oxoacyl-[acyl-carrier protein] reductase
MHKALTSKIGMGRFGTVEEVADVAIMLASNKYMTGTTVTVDGGVIYE